MFLFVHGSGLHECIFAIFSLVYDDMQGRYTDQRKWAWMHDGISAKINTQRCPQMIAQREVLVEASADRNTCCESSHMRFDACKNQMICHSQGALPKKNNLRALACFSCASIKVFCGLRPSVGLETDRAKSNVDIRWVFFFRKNSLFTMHVPFNLAG